MSIPNGMSPDPGGCTSLGSRLVCAKCGCEPQVVNPEKIVNGPMLSVTVKCHGQTETKMIKKEELVFTQSFFQDRND